MKFNIFCDGASRGNPGQAAAGIVIKDESENILIKDGVILGTQTNNVAEYMAVKLSLQRLITDFSDQLPTEVLFQVDSMLIANQLMGQFKIKNEILKSLFDEVKSLEAKVGKVTYQYTPRSNNSLADQLANQALDKAGF